MAVWYKLTVYSCCCCLILSACRKVKSADQDSPIPSLHQFGEFYHRFHTDSIFQWSRILFPLEGKPEQLDTLPYLDTYYWPQETWIMHRLPNVRDTSYERVFQVIDSTLLREIIFHKPSGYSMERRYSYMESGWYLIYYSPMRRPIRIMIN